MPGKPIPPTDPMCFTNLLRFASWDGVARYKATGKLGRLGHLQTRPLSTLSELSAQCEPFDCGKLGVSGGLFAETSGSCYSRTESEAIQLSVMGFTNFIVDKHIREGFLTIGWTTYNECSSYTCSSILWLTLVHYALCRPI